MPKQWNGTLATQTVAFRGSSVVSVLNTTTAAPNFRTISRAVYALNVAGGVSGTFGVNIQALVGGITFVVAGLTAITAVGNYILYPCGYSSTGAFMGAGAVLTSLADVHTIVNYLPPIRVAFESVTATAGISANCTVNATLHQEN